MITRRREDLLSIDTVQEISMSVYFFPFSEYYTFFNYFSIVKMGEKKKNEKKLRASNFPKGKKHAIHSEVHEIFFLFF